MFAKWIGSIGLAAALCCTSAQAQAPASLLHLDFKADVQADGSLANIEPDAALTPALQAMVRKQVAGWRYMPGTWQGKPVPKPVSQRIVAEVVPAAGGGFALRIKHVTSVPRYLDTKRARAAAPMLPPRYPEGAQRQGIEATLVYAMRRDPQGAPIEVELVDAQVPGNWKKQFDEAGRDAIRLWRLEPVEVEGQAIDCRWLTPMTFRLGEGRSPPPTAPALDLRPYLSRFPDACPLSPVLETQVAGVFL
jgi:TonB family protein